MESANNEKILFKYYNVFSQAWYDSEDNVYFARMDDAVEYAKNTSGYFPPYKLYEYFVYELEDGRIEKRPEFLGVIPNQAKRTVEYILSKNVNGNPKQYKVTVNLNEKNKLDYTYEYADIEAMLLKKTR